MNEPRCRVGRPARVLLFEVVGGGEWSDNEILYYDHSGKLITDATDVEKLNAKSRRKMEIAMTSNESSENPYIAALDRLTAEMARLADAEEKRNELLMMPMDDKLDMETQ